MQAVQYGNSIVIQGDSKPYINEMKALGGKWNRNLQIGAGWVFPTKKQNEVLQFISNANAGLIQPSVALPPISPRITTPFLNVIPPSASSPKTLMTPPIPNVSFTKMKPVQPLPSTPINLNYPNKFQAADGKNYQILIYTVPLPKVGQEVKVKIDDSEIDYKVDSLDSDDSIVIVNTTSNEKSRAVVAAGKWQIVGLNQNHEVLFM